MYLAKTSISPLLGLWFSWLSSALAINSTAQSSHTKMLSVRDVLDGNVHDRNSPVEVLAHVRLDRRHDVRNTKALEISGCTGSKEVRGMSVW